MAEFSKLIITEKGRALIAKVLSGSKIDFTRIVTSGQAYDPSQLETLTELTDIQQSGEISKKEIVNITTVAVETAFDNRNLNQGYYMRTLGLYANDPNEGEILYAVTVEVTGNCYMPANKGATVSGLHIQLTVTVGNADHVSMVVDSSVFATIRDINELDEKKLDKSKVVESGIITEKGFVMDGKTCSEVFEAINQKIYPVGSIYMSINPDNPSKIFGGTWISWGEGRVPVGVDASQEEFSTVQKIGGERYHKMSLEELAPHTHTVTGTAVSSGAHAHAPNSTTFTSFLAALITGVSRRQVTGGGTSKGYTWTTDSTSSYDAMGSVTTTKSAGAHTHTVTGTAASTGTGATHNNLQPYITCYMWLRTA